MKTSILEDRFLYEIKEFVEMNNIINILSDKIEQIKDENLNISFLDKEFLKNFHFKKDIFSIEEIEILSLTFLIYFQSAFPEYNCSLVLPCTVI